MSFPQFTGFRKQTKPNTKPNIKIDTDKIIMNTALTFLVTSKGWIIRQALKATAYITVPLTVWLDGAGHGDQSSVIVSGIVAAVSVLIELGLSYVARKNP